MVAYNFIKSTCTTLRRSQFKLWKWLKQHSVGAFFLTVVRKKKEKRKTNQGFYNRRQHKQPNTFASFSDISVDTCMSNLFACKTICITSLQQLPGLLWNKALFHSVLCLAVYTWYAFFFSSFEIFNIFFYKGRTIRTARKKTKCTS